MNERVRIERLLVALRTAHAALCRIGYPGNTKDTWVQHIAHEASKVTHAALVEEIRDEPA